MLLLGSRLLDTPVMSLQTGTELARTNRAIIDPRQLTVVAYELAGPLLDTSAPLLRIADVRELSDIGMIVDSSDEFVGVSDVIKLQQVYDFHFSIINLAVIDEKKRKLGKVVDYTVETGSFVIEQLNVKRPLIKSLSDTELLIHRSQIIEVNDQAIIVRAGERRAEPLRQAVRNYANPFRSAQPESIDANR